MERAWLAIGSVVTVAALVWGTYSVVGVLAHEEVTERAAFDPAGIDVIDIANDKGSIEVVADDVEQISLVAHIDRGLRPTGHRAEIEGSALVVRGSCPNWTTWCHVDYRLVVPAELDVVARTDNGRLTIRDVRGDVDFDAANGSVELARLAGQVRGGTANGSIEATGLRSEAVGVDTNNGRVLLSFAEPPTSVRARSHNGSVEVIVPEGPASYRVRTDTHNGSTDVAVRTDPGSDRSIDAATFNGNVAVHHPTG